MAQDGSYQPQVHRKQGGDVLVIGSGGSVENYLGAGAGSAGATITNAETGPDQLHRTTFTLASTPIVLTDYGASGGCAGIKLYDFPAGKIGILGSKADVTVDIVTGASFGNAVFDVGLGTAEATGSAVNGALSGTYTNILRKIDATAANDSAVAQLTSAAMVSLDGTSTAVDCWLNITCSSATQSANGSATITGTVALTWFNAGDV